MQTAINQKTVARRVQFQGIGLHSGKPISIALLPAAANTGIIFRRTDVPRAEADILVTPLTVTDTQLCTVVSNEYGHKVMTIEHLMAAFSSQMIDNVIVEISGGEAPALDGSSFEFISYIAEAGIRTLNAPKKMIKIIDHVTVEDQGRVASFSPSEDISFAFDIDFESKAIGKQSFTFNMQKDNFDKQISAARTFGFLQHFEQMKKNGLAQGGGLHNAIVLDGDRIVNPEPLRFEDEFVRHKILDAVGDIYVCGMHVQGAYFGSKAGHEMNNKLIRALLANTDAYEIVDMPRKLALKPRNTANRELTSWQAHRLYMPA